jgi:hypothetical protein
MVTKKFRDVPKDEGDGRGLREVTRAAYIAVRRGGGLLASKGVGGVSHCTGRHPSWRPGVWPPSLLVANRRTCLHFFSFCKLVMVTVRNSGQGEIGFGSQLCAAKRYDAGV